MHLSTFLLQICSYNPPLTMRTYPSNPNPPPGPHPLLMALTYASVRPASMGPLRIWEPSRLGCALEKMICVRRCRPSLRGGKRRQAAVGGRALEMLVCQGAAAACSLAFCNTQRRPPRRQRAAHLNSGRICAVGSVSRRASCSSSFTGRTCGAEGGQ